MKILATIREFSSIVFNKPSGDDVELRPETKADDSAAEQIIVIPDTIDSNNDTMALLSTAQTFTNKTLTTPQINDNTSTNQYIFASAGTLAADRTVTLPVLVSNDEFVFKDADQILQNKRLLIPEIDQISNLAGDAFFSLPNFTGSDTLISRDSNDTGANALQNKELTANNVVFIDGTDTSKKINFNIAGLTTSTTRIVAFPDLAGTIALTTGTQILEDKNISGSNNTITNISESSLLAGIDALKIANGSVNNTEFQKLGTIGTDADDEIVDTNTAQTLKNKTLQAFKYNETDVARATTMAKPDETIIHVTGTAGDIQILTGGADGDVKILVNETGGTVSLIENFGVNGFHTGTGADLDLLDNGSVQLIFEADAVAVGNGRWRVIGGAGGSGGGLTLSNISSTTTASANIHYLTDSTGGAFEVTLPAGGTGDVIRFTDTLGTWDTNNVTLTPDGSETIDGETNLILDVERAWVQLMWNGSEWITDDTFDPTVIDLTGDITASGSVKADGGFLTTNTVTVDLTIDSGCTLQHPFLTIGSGVTYTNNGNMVVAGTLITSGTLIDNGTSIVL